MNSEISFTSVTFRPNTTEEVIQIAIKNNIRRIEWGGDIHVPAGDIEKAREVKCMMDDNNLLALSYGSYFKLLTGMDFKQHAESACTIGARTIRIWAGDYSLRKRVFNREELKNAALELKEVCRIAEDYDLSVSLEKHRYTLTEYPIVAAELLDMADMCNLYCYWQPNPELSVEDNLRAIRILKPYISNVHVFSWQKDNTIMPLSYGESSWEKYIEELGNRTYIIEFVRTNSPVQFEEDLQTLRKWI